MTKFKKFFEDSGQLIVLMTFKKDMKIFFIREMYAGEDRTNYPGHRVIESLYVTHHSDFKNMYFNIMIALKHFIENDTRASRKRRRSSFNVRINVAFIFQQQYCQWMELSKIGSTSERDYLFHWFRIIFIGLAKIPLFASGLLGSRRFLAEINYKLVCINK